MTAIQMIKRICRSSKFEQLARKLGRWTSISHSNLWTRPFECPRVGRIKGESKDRVQIWNYNAWKKCAWTKSFTKVQYHWSGTNTSQISTNQMVFASLRSAETKSGLLSRKLKWAPKKVSRVSKKITSFHFLRDDTHFYNFPISWIHQRVTKLDMTKKELFCL